MKPEYQPYGEEWRNHMARLKKADVIRIASEALLQKESDLKERTRVLIEAKTWLETLPKEQFGTYGDDQGTKLWVRDDILDQIKQALRNAGETEE